MSNFFIYFKGTGSHDKCDFRRVVTLGLNKELQNGFNILHVCFVLGQKNIIFESQNNLFSLFERFCFGPDEHQHTVCTVCRVGRFFNPDLLSSLVSQDIT